MSTRLGPYSDSRAVAAQIAAAQFGFDQFFTPIVITGTTPGAPTVYRTVTTPLLKAGLYKVTVSFFLTGSNSGTNIGTNIAFDGVRLPVDFISNAVVPDGSFLTSSVVVQDWTSLDATHTVDYLAWQPSGPGDVTGQTSITTWERKA